MIDLDEKIWRPKIVEEAKTWIGTPYISGQCLKGYRGGTDCAMILVGVYGNLGLIPNNFKPEHYSPQWHVHRNEEKYLNYVLQFTKEVNWPKSGDLVMFKIGHVFAHGAIVIEWPNVIHAVGGSKVLPCDVSKNTTGKRALALVPQRFFSLWGENN